MTATSAHSTTARASNKSQPLQSTSVAHLKTLPGVQLTHLYDSLWNIRETALGACNQPRAGVPDSDGLLTEGAAIIDGIIDWCDVALRHTVTAAEQRVVTDEDDAKACAWVRLKDLTASPDLDGLADLAAVVNASMLRVAAASVT